MKNAKDKVLWEKIRLEAKIKFKAFPSAYASFWISNQYKKQGGEYLDVSSKKSSSLVRWKLEKWINICEKNSSGGYKPCGRADKSEKYPVCRPSVKINKKTPKTVHEMKKSEIESKCKEKRKSPKKKLSKF
jgi:hypothetical protein